TRMIPTRCRVVSPPTKSIPETTRVTIHKANPVNATRSRNATMPPILDCAQQIRVHDPAVTRACLGAKLHDRLADLADSARHQQLVGRAEVGAPPDAGRGRTRSE